MNVFLNSQADVKSLIDNLLDQVLNKENYNLIVEVKVCFLECEPDEEGYSMAEMVFTPWGADAFQMMQEFLEENQSDDYIGFDVVVKNLQEPVEAYVMPQIKLPVNEDNVRAVFNETFLLLDQARSAGSMYVGDNGAYMLDYMDLDPVDCDRIMDVWKEKFSLDSFISHEYNNNCMMVHIS